MRTTYDRATFLAAQRAWAEGDFGPAWRRFRDLAAERGYLYPPSGTKHDDRDAENPSQRAIIWRAIEDNPGELERIVRRSRSWSQVVDGIIGLEDRLREDAGYVEREAAWDRDHRPTYREAVQSLGAILGRVADSVGIDREDAA